MAKIGLVTIISVVINLFLTFWLINQYMSDVYFQSYVNGTIGQYYPFIVLTLGVGGGSGLGYLFLKRKNGNVGFISKIQKSKSFKPPGPMASTAASATSRQILPTGAPPTPVSKHTAYAVPPLPKSSTPSSSRTLPGSSWAATASNKSSLESILSSKQDASPNPSVSNFQPPRTEPTKPTTSSFASVTETQPPQPLRSIGDTPKQSSWSPPQAPTGERRPESGPIFQKPGLEIGSKQDSSFTGFASQPPTPQTSPVPSKWAPPEDKPTPNQWSEGGVKSIPPMPTKWSPSQPSNTQERGPPPQGFPRPGLVPPRGPLSMPQSGPRPFVVQGPGGTGRPGEQRPMNAPRPIAAPQPFRPDPNRPPPGVGPQLRPQPSPRPAAPIGGPMPQPWTPPPQNQEKRDFGEPNNMQQSSPTVTGTSSNKEAADQKIAPEGGSSGEMDWDTALDTILKTLRKDRVGDTK